MQYIGITEAKAHFSAIVDRAISGEEFIITRMGKPTKVRITQAEEDVKKQPLFGCMKGKIKLSDDWEEWDEETARALGIID